MVSEMPDPGIIVALDFPRSEPALDLLDKLEPAACRVKIGKELFTREGPVLIEQIRQRGFGIFLDLKYHDIPDTVAAACRAAANLGVWMLNVHASGGVAMMTAAREAVDKSSHQPLLVAVTVLTSMTTADLEQIGINVSLQDQVLKFAGMAQACGLDGVVCSAQEARLISGNLGTDFKLVTPGIRPAGSDKNDQARIMTPGDAVHAGSHYLVIGRPITQAADPMAALTAIDAEIKSVLVNSE